MGEGVTVRILRGHVLDRLRELPDESVHCCVTSPPYYGLRDYGVAGQLGLEPTLAEYLDNMVAVFREVRRVLRLDGTLWINIGDSYNNRTKVRETNHQPAINGFVDDQWRDRAARGGVRMTELGGSMKEKDLMGVPWRLAFALQADGWYLRSDIIWHKRSTMPESVRDRPTKSHEHIFLLAKSESYYYDQVAASEPATHAGRVVEYDGSQKNSEAAKDPKMATRVNHTVEVAENRNWRDVWSLGPEPFKEAHFATFPTEIPRRAIVAGCPAGGTVLDPFLGSGTTALVADRLQRDCIGIELNPAYADMAERRIRGDSPLFAEVA